MKVWTNTSFAGHYPVGSAAVVVADTAEHAAELLRAELQMRGLGDDVTPEQFLMVDTRVACVQVLADGDY